MTLIAAWKTPGLPGDGNKIEGIRVIADSMLSKIGGHDTYTRWRKVYAVKPSVRVPTMRVDEEYWETFGGWNEQVLRPIGVFFAGSPLAFNATFTTFRDAMETLGLKAKRHADFRPKSSPYPSTITRRADADMYYPVEDICGANYKPVPPFDLSFAAECLAEELRICYTCFTGTRGDFKYSAQIGLAGYCEATEQFRIFHIASKEVLDDEGFTKEQPEVTVSELEDTGLLLLGVPDKHADLRCKIEEVISKQDASFSEAERLSLARQSVVEACIISGGIDGVKGPLIRAEVSDEGFNFTEKAWTPKERIWDSDGLFQL